MIVATQVSLEINFKEFGTHMRLSHSTTISNGGRENVQYISKVSHMNLLLQSKVKLPSLTSTCDSLHLQYILQYMLSSLMFVLVNCSVGAACYNLHATGAGDEKPCSTSTNIKVYVRVRPLSKDECARGETVCIHVTRDDRSVKVFSKH